MPNQMARKAKLVPTSETGNSVSEQISLDVDGQDLRSIISDLTSRIETLEEPAGP